MITFAILEAGIDLIGGLKSNLHVQRSSRNAEQLVLTRMLLQ